MGVPLFETSNQLWVLLTTVYGGAVLGLLFDLFTAVRAILRAKRFVTVLFDAAYWCIATVFAFALLYYACDGEFRYYHILGFALGAALYFLGPGSALRATSKAIARFFHGLWQKAKETRLVKFLIK